MKNWKRRLTLFLGVFLAAYLAICVYFWAIQTGKIFDPSQELLTDPSRMGMDYDRVEIPLTSGGEQIRLDGIWIPAKIGEAINIAPSILYLHGQDDNIGKNLEHSVRQLHALGYNVLQIDYRGYGTSPDVNLSEQTVNEDAAAAWRFLITDRGAKPERTFIYGHSLGGAIAMNLAIDHREAAGLILESTFTSVIDMSYERYAGMLRLLPLRLLIRHHFDSKAKIGKLKLPVFLIHGTADAKIPDRMSDELYDMAPEPKDLLKIKGGEHANSASIGAVEFKARVSAFVEKHIRPAK